MFRDPARAQRNLAALDRRLSPQTRDVLLSLLGHSPDPDSALHYLERYCGEAAPAAEVTISNSSRLNALLAVFAHSHFLSETLFQRPELLDWALDRSELHRVLSLEELRSELGEPTPLELARFKRRHLLRLLLRDVLGLATLAEVALELSLLADTLLEAALDQARQEVGASHGSPRLAAEGHECEFVVLSLGKLGGQELNYSSDVDLLYLYEAPGQTDGPEPVTNREFFIQLANRITGLLSSATVEGRCYRVDLRLRPEGTLGEVALPLVGARDYYRQRARDWELQMLIKARVSAGSRALGRQFLDFVEPLIYKTTTDFSAVESVSRTRERIHEKLRRRSVPGLDVKLNRGGIRDIEFLVQCLQRLYGGRDPWVRHGGTQLALDRLRDKGYIAARDYARLNSAYEFLRVLEHRLQLEHDRQIHTLPQDPAALATLARKMAAANHGRPLPAGALLRETERHLGEVAEIYDRVIHGHGPVSQSTTPEPVSLFQLEAEHPEDASEMSMQAQIRYLRRSAPEVGARLAAAPPLIRARKLFEHFLGKLISLPDLLAEIEQRPELIELAADVFEASPFFAEWLIRNPGEIHELLEVAAFAPSDQQGDLFPADPDQSPEGARVLRGAMWARDNPELQHLIRTRASRNEKSAWLRRSYRRQMLRIQAESICRRSPIFSTLEQTSELADRIVAAAYQIAVDEVMGPAGPRSAPLHVVALGRLGMREFDLGSDADLVFILPDQAQPELAVWVRVAERLLDVLTSYTGEGVLFSVDTRLRPLGREGELVQTESAYKKYFAGPAQAWEAITYMKTRCLAGDIDRGTSFLHELQNIDWRSYGQSGDLAVLLSGMRRRLEREQGVDHPLKAARGAYYDIDFVLMYLRLRGAGIFYRSLNTPERIEVIERMGLLKRQDAETLHTAAVFYRALDHGLRLQSGRSQGKLPGAPTQLAALTELVRRWTPPALHGLSLSDLLAQMRLRTREMFDQVFQSPAVKQ